MKTVDFKIRSPEPKDLNFITSTFLKSMKTESSLGRSTRSKIFFKEFNEVLDYILSVSTTLIACEKDTESTILAYLIYENETIHYCYVRPSVRRFEIAKDLLLYVYPDKQDVYFSQNTNDSKKICKKYPELVFNPFTLYRKLPKEP